MGYETQHNSSPKVSLPRLLLADDTTQALGAYAAVLREAGYEVTWAQHPEEALQHLRAQSFALVLCHGGQDAQGEAFLQAMHDVQPQLPAIVMSGHQGPSAAAAGHAHGAHAHGGSHGPAGAHHHASPRVLQHPISADALLQALGEAIGARNLSSIAPEPYTPGPQTTGILLGPAAISSPAVALAGELDIALASLFMAYQPIVDCSRHTLFGYEALVRGKPGNLASPPALLAAAESLGRLQELSRQIRAQVAHDIATMPEETHACRLFVNLHAQDLLDPALYDPEAPLSKHAHRIVLEVTERTPLEEVPDVLSRVSRLRAMGYRLALDDLGAGYAGLSTFAQLEPEVVKLDMALVRQVESSRTKRHIIASMVQLCERLGIHVVAEGIETIAERDVLLALGCQLLQGYYFGRPNRTFAPPTY